MMSGAADSTGSDRPFRLDPMPLSRGATDWNASGAVQLSPDRIGAQPGERIVLKPLALSFAFALAATPAIASACSVVPGYRVPTSLELAERAEVIILGTVDRALPGADAFETHVAVTPTTLIKGPGLPDEVRLWGHLASDGMKPTHSDPRELHDPNPDALAGACTRYVFDKGMTLLLFLERHDGELRPARYAFARIAEDVPTPEARWVKAVRLYAEVSALPEAERVAALRDRQKRLRAQTGDADAQAIAADIDRQLAGDRPPPRD